MNNETLIKNLRNVPDFPIPGIQFKDVSTLFKNAKCMRIMVNELYELYKDKGEWICESRYNSMYRGE